jgi:hypothetical protein
MHLLRCGNCRQIKPGLWQVSNFGKVSSSHNLCIFYAVTSTHSASGLNASRRTEGVYGWPGEEVGFKASVVRFGRYYGLRYCKSAFEFCVCLWTCLGRSRSVLLCCEFLPMFWGVSFIRVRLVFNRAEESLQDGSHLFKHPIAFTFVSFNSPLLRYSNLHPSVQAVQPRSSRHQRPRDPLSSYIRRRDV